MPRLVCGIVIAAVGAAVAACGYSWFRRKNQEVAAARQAAAEAIEQNCQATILAESAHRQAVQAMAANRRALEALGKVLGK